MAALLIGVIAVFSNLYTTQPLLPLFSQLFNVPPATSGLTISAVVLSVALAALVYGPLSDRIGHKPVMVWTGFALLVPTLGAALAGNFAVLLLCRALQGLLIPGTTAVGIAYIQEQFPPAWRGSAMGAYVSATVLGGLAGRVQSGLIADAIGWRWAFVAAAVTTAVSVALMAAWLPDAPRAAVRADGGRASLLASYRGLGRFFWARRVMGAALVGAALFFTFTGILTYLPYRMTGPPFDLSTGAISLLYLAYLVGLVVTPWTGRLSDLLGRRLVLGGALVSIGAGALLTAAPSIVVVVAGLVLLSSGMFAAQATATAFVGDNAGGAPGSAASFYLLWYYLGATVSPTLTGLAWQARGWSGVLVLCLGVLGVALGALVTLCR